MDGYHVSHDPARSSTVEPTTGRELNILDVPGSTSSKPSSRSSSSRHSSSHTSNHSSSRHTSSSSYSATTRSSGSAGLQTHSRDVPKGRALSPSNIQSPQPYKPHETRRLTTLDYRRHPTYEELAEKFAAANLGRIDSDEDSDIDSDVPSLGSYGSGSSRSSSTGYSSATSPSSSGSTSPSNIGSFCKCDRYGLTRKGDRVRLDCGGGRCGSGIEKGFSDSGSSLCGSESEKGYKNRASTTHRHATVVRAPKRL